MSVYLPIFKGFSLTNQRKKAKIQSNMADVQLQQTLIDSDREIKDWNARLIEKQQSGKRFASCRSGGFFNEMHQETEMIKLTKIF